jgi:hypothetical protein
MNLLIIGYGYSSKAILKQLGIQPIAVTCRTQDKAEKLRSQGLTVHIFDGTKRNEALAESLKKATHLLISAPPEASGEKVNTGFSHKRCGKQKIESIRQSGKIALHSHEIGDPFLHCHADDLHHASALRWMGYLSTVGVYGDHQGHWIDETAPLDPTNERGQRRVEAEEGWAETGKPLAIFRLSGIYGPSRSAFDKLRSGKARCVIKPDQVFNRIHVEDIGRFVAKAMTTELTGVYNLTDDEPAPPQDVITYAAGLMGVEPPPAIDFEEADMSPMARSFYSDNKRVSNEKIKQALKLSFLYPTYREGLKALAMHENNATS